MNDRLTISSAPLVAFTLCASLVTMADVARAQNGSLYHTSQPGQVGQPGGPLMLNDASFTLIEVEPPRELRIHDTITIIVDEKSQLLSEGEVERRKQANLFATLADWLQLSGGLDIKPAAQADGDPTINASLNSQYRANAELETRDGLKFRIGATIVDIRPNGNLVIEAHKTVRNNNEVWEQYITGVVSPEDVLPNRSVLSEKITELSIKKLEHGHVRDGYRRGWFLKILDKVQPF